MKTLDENMKTLDEKILETNEYNVITRIDFRTYKSQS